MRSFAFLMILLLVSATSVGQETLDVLTLSGRYGFPQSYDSIYKSKANEYGAMAALVAPIKINEKSIWFNSLNYFYFHVGNNEDTPPEIMNPIDVHGIILRTGLYQKFSKDRAIQIFIAPRLMTDFKNINSDHFQMGALFLYEKKFREGLKMGFGLMYNQEFFGPNLVPLVNVDWQISERWSVTGMFPIYGKVIYKVNERLSAGLSHFGLITSYRLGDAEYKGDYMERKSIDEALFARYQLFGNIYLEGRFGYALGRSYAQYEADQKVDLIIPLVSFGDNRTQKNITFHDGLIASLRFIYNVPIENNKK
jgi:hypothetical protein